MAWVGVGAACGVWGGCENREIMAEKGSILAGVFNMPTPIEAAQWFNDPHDADKRYRGTLLLANAPFGGEDVYVRGYVQNLEDSDAGVRAMSARALGSHGSPEHVPLLLRHFGDENAALRLEVAKALQRLHNPVAVDALVQRLRPSVEREDEVRAESATALGQYAENRVVQSLVASLADPSLLVNRNAAASLTTLTGQEFGLDRRSWLRWLKDSPDAFAGRREYIYPVFSRDKRWFEHIPFIPGPPNEIPSLPAGMLPGDRAPGT